MTAADLTIKLIRDGWKLETANDDYFPLRLCRNDFSWSLQLDFTLEHLYYMLSEHIKYLEHKIDSKGTSEG